MNFVTATAQHMLVNYISHFAIILKSSLKCMLTWFEDEINDEILNKICKYNVSYRDAQTIFLIFPKTG